MFFKYCFLCFFKPKNSKVQILGFLCINFWYKFCAQIIRLLFLYYNFIFNLHEFTLPLASVLISHYNNNYFVSVVVFSGYF